MQVSCRLLSQESFTVSADPSTTVGEVKRKIEELKGASFKAESLKLIYSGKVLAKDEATLEEEKYDEKGFMVVMVSKPKAPPKPAEVAQGDSSSTSSSTTTPATAAPQPAGTAVQTPTRLPVAQAPPAAATNPVVPAAASPAVTGAFGFSPAEISAMVDGIAEMGYPKAEVEQALRASFFNQERAVEYLISGVPAGSAAVPSNPVAAAAPASNQPVAAVQPPVAQGGAAEHDALADLRDSPQFAMMRQMVQQDPTLLEQFMQSIGNSNPALLDAIRNNEEDFLAMLNSPDDGEDDDDMEGEEFLDGEGGEGGEAPQGVHYVNVTPAEQAAIERLKALGFPEQMVIEAFIACDKNEEMAANLLFSGLGD
ncbi:putative UV excision repair protein RAD23-like protein B [Hypsibius exemplaris]|uniref:UV excision repair protein RAD23 n=1 Tax=Hypsibius exemplaris TaxID=2072580 RepID=A0A1W0X1C8_HYPEX|nr:putative UV excision repair protein RAD23-like protein B [Hypsibius exemplaris]